MFKERLELLKKTYKAEMAKQGEYKKNPESKDSKKAARIGGAFLILFGLIIGFGTYMGYRSTGRILVLGAGLTIACIGLGFYAVVTGKIPQKK